MVVVTTIHTLNTTAPTVTPAVLGEVNDNRQENTRRRGTRGTTGRTTGGGGRAWVHEESLLALEALGVATCNCVKGTAQSATQFQESIKTAFDALKIQFKGKLDPTADPSSREFVFLNANETREPRAVQNRANQLRKAGNSSKPPLRQSLIWSLSLSLCASN